MKTARQRKIIRKPARSHEPFFKPAAPSFETEKKSPSAKLDIQAIASMDTAPVGAPAWSKNGSVFLGAGFFAASPAKQSEIFQHERVHALHQQTAPTDNSHAARSHAEYLANNPSMANARELAVPAPALLAFPPQPHAPWHQVYLGHDYLIGEIVEKGITLRIALTYDEIGIKEQTQKTDMDGMEMDIVTKQKSAVYHCGKHPYKPLENYVKRLQKVAAVVATLNAKIPAGAMWRTDLVVIATGVNQAYRIANGKGVMELEDTDINTQIILDSVAHEAAHGVFEHHSTVGDSDITKRVPDNFAMHVAQVYAQLANTKIAIEPTGPFNASIKPVAPAVGVGGRPAGLIMVFDTLWSGKGGHPWDGVDEFFASAYGAYIQNKSLLNKIIDHYIAYDPAIKPIKPVLLNLLKITGDQKKTKALKTPVNNADGIAALGAVKPVPDHTAFDSNLGIVNTLIDPSLLKGPSAIKC